MKKTLFLTLTLSLLLASCSVFSKLSEVEYNNQVVDQINLVSTAIEDSATLYNETVPDVVTEASVIDTTQMKISHETASLELLNVEPLMILESRNIEQQNSVRTEIQTYESAANDYLDLYGQMLDYYASSAYVEDLNKVKSFHKDLHTSYTTFIQANNDLVDILDGFVSKEE